MNKPGRKSLYTNEIGLVIAERLSKGEPLAQICREDGMPSDNTVRDWQSAYPDFAVVIARAREAGHDYIASECMTIADDSRNDYIEKMASGGDEQAVKALAFNAEHVQRSKLRIETRLKLLSKWDPKRWGDKIEIDQQTTIISQTDEQINDRIRQLSTKVSED
jgi:hypothetical protein